MANNNQFITDGVLTAAGERVLSYAESLVEKTDKAAYDNLPGVVKAYIAHVKYQKTATREGFAETYGNSLQVLAEQMQLEEDVKNTAAAQAEQVSKVSDLEAQLAQLKEDLSARVADLERENEDLKKQLAERAARGRKPKAEEPKADAEPESEDKADEPAAEG